MASSSSLEDADVAGGEVSSDVLADVSDAETQTLI